jgi:hypothetical protein
MVPALAFVDYRRLLLGQLVSLTGSQMQQVAVVWQLYLVSRSPWALGLLGLFRVVPTGSRETRDGHAGPRQRSLRQLVSARYCEKPSSA